MVLSYVGPVARHILSPGSRKEWIDPNSREIWNIRTGGETVRTAPTGRPRGLPPGETRAPATSDPDRAASDLSGPSQSDPPHSGAARGFYPPAGYPPVPVPGHASEDFRSRALELALTGARWLAYAFAAWFALATFLIFVYRFANPPLSALMLQRALTGNAYDQHWVTYDAIAPNAVRAVMVSEDGRFCEHWGVDFDAMQSAIERAGKKGPRGASTISMQVAKNLFLWPSKSYVRKVLEIPLTFMIESWWPKRRIMEVYLNVAEWGPGIFGIEAASRYHFSKPALHLSPRESAQLAAALPNPIRRDAGEPGPQTRRLASLVHVRSQAAPRYMFACLTR